MLLESWLRRRRDRRARPRARAALAMSAASLAWAFWETRPLESPTPRPCPCAWETLATDTGTRIAACGGCVAARDHPPVRGPARLLFGERLDLQCETAAALEVVPGIGPHRARAIALARDRKLLRSLADLDDVSGIGPKTIATLERWVMVSGRECRSVAQPLPSGEVKQRERVRGVDGEEGAER